MRLHPTTWNKIDTAIPDKALDLGLSLSLTKLLYARFTTDEERESFLHPSLITDPMVGELEAANRIIKAVTARERIGIFGDYDVDGVTSSALLFRLFQHHGITPVVFIPSRYQEGYGLNPKSVHLVKDIDLLISVDCGISSITEVNELMAQGIDVIITDHHEPKEVLPQTIVMNPKLGNYPFPDLAGVGVAYKLAKRLESLGLALPEGLIELAALGTVADVMPLVSENRAIVKAGLAEMSKSQIPGLRQLFTAQRLSQPYRASDLAFRIGPLLNAVGRLDSPWPAFELLIESDTNRLIPLVEQLIQANNQRKVATDRIMSDVEKRISQVPAFIIEKSSDWLGGVLGLAASKVAEKYRRPVILMEENDVIKGSGRSIGNFSLLGALEAQHEWLHRFGGHKQAAGLELHDGAFDDFRQAMIAYAERELTEDDTLRSYTYHPIELSDIRLEFLDQLDLLEPFGVANPSPLFRLNGMILQAVRLMGKDQTTAALEFKVCDRLLRVLTFGVTPEDWQVGISYDLLFRLDRNTFQGVTQLQLMLVDYRESEWRLTPKSPVFDDELNRLWQLVISYNPSVSQEGVLSIKRALEEKEPLAQTLGRLSDSPYEEVEELVSHLPTRTDLVATYKELKASEAQVDLHKHPDPARLLIQVKLFEQLGLLTYTKNDFLIKLDWHDQSKKFDLDHAIFYRQSQKILEDFHELNRLDSRR